MLIEIVGVVAPLGSGLQFVFETLTVREVMEPCSYNSF